MGMIADRLRDHDRAERLLREAHAIGDDGGAMFNLALVLRRRGQFDRAYACSEEAIKRRRLGPYFVLRAQIASQLKQTSTRDAALAESLRFFGEMKAMSDWELGWAQAGAELRGDKETVQAIGEERKRRRSSVAPPSPGELPTLHLQKRTS
jgi:tetratricopeptide (TPR) repeat protein